MPQPPAYARTFSFTEDEAGDPSGHVPGVSLDSEFDGVAASIKGILSNLLKIQRDDGALKNALVTLDSLSPAVLTALGAGSTWVPRGAWLTATEYALGDVISEGTATFVCAIPHGSGVFAADLAAGAWIKLFDDGGTIPADGSVTSAKFAPGAVDDVALGISTFDIAGAGRAAGGLAAGTAPKGALLHAKLDAGDVHAKTERLTDAQGAVGYKIIGVGVTWTLEQAAGSANLRLTNGTVTYTFEGDVAEFPALRAVGVDPAAGVGVWLSYVGGVGLITAKDIDGNAWKDLRLRGGAVYLTAQGVDIAKVSSTGMNILPGKSLTINNIPVGYLGIPQNPENAAYALAASDNGGHVYSTTAAAQTITAPALTADFTTLIINDGTANITLQQGAGVTLRLAGSATTGNRTIAPGGMAFVKYVTPTRAFVSGPGTS